MVNRPTKNFGLIENGREVGTFSGYQPRDAALKCASRGKTNIMLREKGTKRLHVFKGFREKVRAPSGAPSWLPSMVWKPNVKKIGVRHLKYNQLSRNPFGLLR
ncbi:MAG: non-histone chromosomal MC1 family protein [Methanosarcinales archaeon Met12]|nr:MAG: non-histone chromosomal MC1 family protein [Methanosarcinales archaeon Met12]